MEGWERELVDPDFRPPSYYQMMTVEFATREYEFPAPLPKAEVTAYDGSIWVFDNLGSGQWDLTNYPPTGDPYQFVKIRERERKSRRVTGGTYTFRGKTYKWDESPDGFRKVETGDGRTVFIEGTGP